ncbi:GNAT family N-acetyltransferase [Deinococcus sp.]|uniref:GNAT family N-acetyltransferase n=1 Tax=Deinococcus sp. TaxID=47478 RepID=UPI003B5B2699
MTSRIRAFGGLWRVAYGKRSSLITQHLPSAILPMRRHIQSGQTGPMSDFTLREMRVPADFATVASIRNAADSQWPVTPELLAAWDASRDPALYHSALVAELGSAVVGYLGVGHDDFAFQENRYFGHLYVHPDFQRRGIGSALHARMLKVLRGRGAHELRTMMAENNAPGIAFLERNGYRPTWRRLDLRLNVSGAELSRFDDLLASVAARGLHLVSIADLAADKERDERLYELDWLLFQDVPMGQTLTKKPLNIWVAEELQDPNFEAALSFVVLDPKRDDPLTGPYVGYSTLMGNPGGFFVIGMTGILREYRRMGLAKALKVAGMRALQAKIGDSGSGEIRTFNDPPNVAMVNMNEALGFMRFPGQVRYELLLEKQA